MATKKTPAASIAKKFETSGGVAIHVDPKKLTELVKAMKPNKPGKPGAAHCGVAICGG